MTPFRVAIGLGALVVAALFPTVSVVLQLATASEWWPPGDTVSGFERRYVTVREGVRGETEIGYIPPLARAPAGALAHLYLTRYTLAPVQVMVESTKPLAIADAVTDRSRLPAEFTVRQDFGGGLYLLERVPQ